MKRAVFHVCIAWPTAALRTWRFAAPLALGCLVAFMACPPAVGAAPYPWRYDLSQTLISLPIDNAPAPFVVDWNNDGLSDLVVGMKSPSTSGGIALYLRADDGSLLGPFPVFASGDATTVVGSGQYYRPLVVDWDGDGAKDLIFGQMSSTRGVVFCPNEGTDASPVFNGGNCEKMVTTSGQAVGATTGSSVAFVSPHVVDWDNDGDFDLLVGTGRDANEKGIRLYLNVGEPVAPLLAAPVFVVSKTATPGLSFEIYYEPDVVDINGDGRKDLMIGGSQYSLDTTKFVLRQCLNTGTDATPGFANCSAIFVPGLVHNVIDFHDWDGDGYLDLLTGFYSAFIANPVTYFHGMGPDPDGDGLSDSIDNCPSIYNPADMKLDGANPAQIDTDGDGTGDACDGDADGDGVLDSAPDNCPWTPNPSQSDVDADGRGDDCDPEDGRPGQPGIGSYEWQQANRIEWGRRPVIILRADALSLSFRRDIAITLTNDALTRGIPFSLAVIPWNETRFAGSPSADFLNAVNADPNMEVVQHGTYHACEYTGGSGAEFDCGMDAARSFNLMRVGRDSLMNSIDMSYASHPFRGFIPPEDAYDDAAGEAMAALGYRYVSSGFYVEYPQFVWVDSRGLVHIPWSQTVCGNGFASWINCQTTAIDAHTGVDCADETICKPTKDGKIYDPWTQYAATALKERCRYDLQTRYGVCSVLFELAAYDNGSGALDLVAFQSYQMVLTDLQALAIEAGAVFMTLGDFAAAKLINDTQKPTITINSPAATTYGHDATLTIDFDVADDLSGIYRVQATLDGRSVSDGEVVNLLTMTLGAHTLAVQAEDTAGNLTESSVTFQVVATVGSLTASINIFVAGGQIDNHGVANALLSKLSAVESATTRGDSKTARNILDAFVSQVEAQLGKHITEAAARLLITDALYIRGQL